MGPKDGSLGELLWKIDRGKQLRLQGGAHFCNVAQRLIASGGASCFAACKRFLLCVDVIEEIRELWFSLVGVCLDVLHEL